MFTRKIFSDDLHEYNLKFKKQKNKQTFYLFA